ncbi:hypothetical protein ACSBR2_018813 [Camellia fascicularis]
MDQISIQKGRIVTLEEGNGLEKIIDKVQAPVAAVVVMTCNRANYLERALKSILKYQSSVPSKYLLFVSQDEEDPDVKTKALSYNQLTYMPVITNRHWINCFINITLVELSYLKMICKFPLISSTILRLQLHSLKVISPLWLFLHGMTMDKSSLCRILTCFTIHIFSLDWGGCWLNLRGMNSLQSGQKHILVVDWKSMDLNYLMEDKYVKHFADMVKNARPVCGTDDVLKECNIDCDVRIQYKDETDFEHIARQFGIFEE